MLQLTQIAATHLGEAMRQQGLSDDHGVRVSGATTPDGQVALQVAFAEEPAEDDQVDEQHGTRVFVASDVAGPLSEAEMDVQTEDEEAQLVLRQRDTGESGDAGDADASGDGAGSEQA